MFPNYILYRNGNNYSPNKMQCTFFILCLMILFQIRKHNYCHHNMYVIYRICWFYVIKAFVRVVYGKYYYPREYIIWVSTQMKMFYLHSYVIIFKQCIQTKNSSAKFWVKFVVFNINDYILYKKQSLS